MLTTIADQVYEINEKCMTLEIRAAVFAFFKINNQELNIKKDLHFSKELKALEKISWADIDFDLINNLFVENDCYPIFKGIPEYIFIHHSPAFLLMLYEQLLCQRERVDLSTILRHAFTPLVEFHKHENKNTWFFKQTPEQQIIWARVLLNYINADYSSIGYDKNSFNISYIFPDVVKSKAYNIYKPLYDKIPLIEISKDYEWISKQSIEENVKYAKSIQLVLKKDICLFLMQNVDNLQQLNTSADSIFDFIFENYGSNVKEYFFKNFAGFVQEDFYYKPLDGYLPELINYPHNTLLTVEIFLELSTQEKFKSYYDLFPCVVSYLDKASKINIIDLKTLNVIKKASIIYDSPYFFHLKKYWFPKEEIIFKRLLKLFNNKKTITEDVFYREDFNYIGELKSYLTLAKI